MTHVREMDEMIQGERERLESRLAEAMELLKRYREALKFYAGSENDSWWEKNRFYAVDKFGGLCVEISGPFMAEKELDSLVPEWMKEYLK